MRRTPIFLKAWIQIEIVFCKNESQVANPKIQKRNAYQLRDGRPVLQKPLRYSYPKENVSHSVAGSSRLEADVEILKPCIDVGVLLREKKKSECRFSNHEISPILQRLVVSLAGGHRWAKILEESVAFCEIMDRLHEICDVGKQSDVTRGSGPGGRE